MLDSPRIYNPLVSFVTTASEDDERKVSALIEFMGDGGEAVVVEFNEFNLIAAMAELFWEAACEVYEGQENGIQHLVAVKGEFMEEQEAGEEYYVQHFLDGDKPGAIPVIRNDIEYPWYKRIDEEEGDEL